MLIKSLTRFFSCLLGNIKLLLIKVCNLNSFHYDVSDIISPLSNISLVKGKIRFGKKCRIDRGTVVGAINGNVRFGNGCYVNRNCQIVSHESIEIGNNVIIGPNTIIMDHDHKLEEGVIKKQEYSTQAIAIEDGVWIGANCVILKGVTIGKGSVVAAGSIVTHNCPANSLLVQKKVTEIKKLANK